MAEREVFPFADDRALIAEFLRGSKTLTNTDWLVTTHTGALGTTGGTTIAWFDTAGALTVKLVDGMGYNTVVRVIHEICAQLGIKDVRVEREQCDETEPGENGGIQYKRVFTYYIDGVPVTLDQAVVLVGPMGMAAWRESVK